VTGLGGTRLEPCIAHWQEVIGQLPELVAFAGDPRRVSVRYDPIIHWYEGHVVKSNLLLFEPILQSVHRAGVATIRLSFATLYGKVRKRREYRWYDPTLKERLDITGKLVRVASSVGIEIHACSQGELHAVGALPSRCIDGDLLSALHPRGLLADKRVDPGQRRDCGCTMSVDIGSYSMRCPNGCRYCYANPRILVSA